GSDWQRIMARNEWFQQHALKVLRKITPELLRLGRRPTLLAFSYAARNVFRYAKAQGWLTILEQIDAGPVDEALIADAHLRANRVKSNWTRAPASYWQDWREECELSDWVLVNSQWTAEAIQQAGVPHNKISVTPLTFEAPEFASGF